MMKMTSRTKMEGMITVNKIIGTTILFVFVCLASCSIKGRSNNEGNLNSINPFYYKVEGEFTEPELFVDTLYQKMKGVYSLLSRDTKNSYNKVFVSGHSFRRELFSNQRFLYSDKIKFLECSNVIFIDTYDSEANQIFGLIQADSSLYEYKLNADSEGYLTAINFKEIKNNKEKEIARYSDSNCENDSPVLTSTFTRRESWTITIDLVCPINQSEEFSNGTEVLAE